MQFENLKVNLKNSAEMVVEEKFTALAMGSGSLKVLATPQMICLMEKAATDLVEKILPTEFTSVGILMNVKHTAPTPVGMKIHADAEIISVEERKIIFEVAAYDEVGEIGRGTHERFIVQREKFQNKADEKLNG